MTAAAATTTTNERPNERTNRRTDDRTDGRTTTAEDVVANARDLLFAVYPKGPKAAWRNVLAGFAVSLAMIPESVAFAFVAGVTPIVGLWSPP